MSTLTQEPVHMEDLMNLNVDPDAAVVDPQLTMPFFGHLSGKAPEQLTVDPTMWHNPLDTSAQQFSSLVDPHDFHTTMGHDEDAASVASDSPQAAEPTRSQKGRSSRTSSHGSVPALSSGSSSPGARQTRRKANKTNKTQDEETKSAKKKQKTKKEPVSEDEDDPKRSKYLERNRIAASKCRQKKKAWVGDLETQKCELEAMHGNLQREYTSLVEQVTQLKNDLMGHAGCGDANIDGWLETEAKRFVQRTTDHPVQRPRRLSSCGSGSSVQAPSLSESTLQHSPTFSTGFPGSPMVKYEDINYDHMPDDMFT